MNVPPTDGGSGVHPDANLARRENKGLFGGDTMPPPCIVSPNLWPTPLSRVLPPDWKGSKKKINSHCFFFFPPEKRSIN